MNTRAPENNRDSKADDLSENIDDSEMLDEIFLDDDLISIGVHENKNIQYIPEEDSVIYQEVYERIPENHDTNTQPSDDHESDHHADGPYLDVITDSSVLHIEGVTVAHKPNGALNGAKNPKNPKGPKKGKQKKNPQASQQNQSHSQNHNQNGKKKNGQPKGSHGHKSPSGQKGKTSPKKQGAPLNPTLISTATIVPTPAPVGRARPSKKGSSYAGIVALAVVFVIVAAIIFVAMFPWDITVKVNGKDVGTKAHTAASQVVESSGVKVDAGDLLAIDGTVIEADKGTPYTLKVNGEIAPLDMEIGAGDTIEVSDGENVVENFTEEEVSVTPPVVFEGTGAVHMFTDPGTPGIAMRKTGETSGIIQDTVIQEPAPQTMTRFNIDTNGDKVIALTFDDGPWPTYTEEILDVLAANGAKATFFTVGERIEGHEELVQREYAEGHEIATHSWDHAAGSGQGVNLGYMTPEEQHQEIKKGIEIIAEATGAPASECLRVPGGNLNEETAAILSEYSNAEIGWNVDTTDWQKPGASVIERNILSVGPGGIILMHDGGGDRSQTVTALQNALPALISEGYEFVTISELIERYAQPLTSDESGATAD